MKPKNIVYRLGSLEGLQNINHVIRAQKPEQTKGVEEINKEQKKSTCFNLEATKVNKTNVYLAHNLKKSKFIYKAKKNK